VRRALGAVLLASLAPAACRAPRDAGDPLALLERQQAAWNEGDVEGFAAEGYWQSPELTFFSGGDVVKGYGPFLERFRARYGESRESMGRLEFSGLELVWRDSDGALVRGRWRLTGRASAPDAGGLFTLFLRRFGDGWRIVHDHTSSPG
jgi:ketosteroid isomerase-like protein